MLPQVNSIFVYPHISNGDEGESQRDYQEDDESRRKECTDDIQGSPRQIEMYDQNNMRTSILPERLDTLPCNTQESMLENDNIKLSLSIRSGTIPQSSYRNIDYPSSPTGNNTNRGMIPTSPRKSSLGQNQPRPSLNPIHSSFKSRLEKITQPDFSMSAPKWSLVFMYDYLKILVYLYKQFRQSHKVDLTCLPRLEDSHEITGIYERFSGFFFAKQAEKDSQDEAITANDFLNALLRTFKSAFLKMACQLVLFFVLKFASSLFLRELLNAISNEATQVEIYLWTVAICLTMTMVSMTDQHYGRDLVVVYQSLRVIIMKHVHAKVASLSYFTINQNNVGKILNLVSNDLKVLETKTGEIIKLPILPFPTIAVAAISFYRYGVYSLAGLSFMIICVPIQTLLAKLSKRYFQARANENDKRIQLVNEVLEGIRLIKLYAWEDAFLKMLSVLRSSELRLLLLTKLIQVIESSLSLSSGIISCFFMFYLVFHYGDAASLTLANMYSTLDIFLFLRQEVISISGIGITGFLELKVVMKRIVNILNIQSIEMLCIDSLEKKEASNQKLPAPISIIVPSSAIGKITENDDNLHNNDNPNNDNSNHNNDNSNSSNNKTNNDNNNSKHNNSNRTDQKNIHTNNGEIIVITQNNEDEDLNSINKSHYKKRRHTSMGKGIDNLNEEGVNIGIDEDDVSLLTPIGTITLNDFFAFWKQDAPAVLDNINIDIQPGQLVTIIGSVSAGKTSLLSCFNSEMPYYSGRMNIKGKVAYVEQEPFIFNFSIRDNILFGLDYDQYLYQQVLEATDMKRDVENSPQGDQLMVGEKGGSLSGGQRARLSLARALYSQADIYLLDDPLSALDVRVAKVIFQKAIKGFLKDKTVLLVTHTRDFMDQSDRILGFVNGSITRQGSPSEMLDYLTQVKETKKEQQLKINKKQNQYYQQQLREKSRLESPRIKNYDFSRRSKRDVNRVSQHLLTHHLMPTSSQVIHTSNSLQAPGIYSSGGPGGGSALDSSMSLSHRPPSIIHSYQQIFNIASPNTAHLGLNSSGSFHLNLLRNPSIKQGTRSFGGTLPGVGTSSSSSEDKCDVTKTTYKKYMGFSTHKFLLPVCLLLFMSCEITYIFFTQTIGKFSSDKFNDFSDNINLLGFLSAGYFLNMILKRYLLSILANDINYNIHQEMLRTALSARISYFDKTPTGHILNRFSTDLSVLDSDLSKVMTESVEVVCNTLTLIVTIILMNPYFLVIAVASAVMLGIFFSLAKDVLIKTKQFDLSLKSSVFSFFSMSISGIMPIKIYCQANSFGIQFNGVLNESLRTSFSYWFSTRGFGMYIIFIAQIASIIGIFLALVVNQSGSSMGSMITFFISLGYKLQSGLRQLIQLDVVMSSAERIFTFMDIPVEPAHRLDYDKTFLNPPEVLAASKQSSPGPRNRSNTITNPQMYSFPKMGKVIFKNVYMSYREDNKPVLNGVSFVAQAGQKVALIGRTGAGKSSILQALFRMFELQKLNTLPSQEILPVNTSGSNHKKQPQPSMNDINDEDLAPGGESKTQGDNKNKNLAADKQNATGMNKQEHSVGSVEFNHDLESVNDGDGNDYGEGYIKIDGHHIDTMGLKTLREGITIIPQVPFIFTASLRKNIDPLERYSDDQIWTALTEVDKVNEMKDKLDTEISNSSDQFSAGQRQMICLVRAILKKTKLLILDEITSNIDLQTEEWIQTKIRENFPDSTILTIAHRLLTIADYDRVVVLEAGRVAEKGSPASLLTNPDGIFTSMVNSTGEATASVIRSIANSKRKGLITLKSAL